MQQRTEPGIGNLDGLEAQKTRTTLRVESSKRRRPLLALLLGFFFAPVAFTYVGRPWTGLFIGVAILGMFALFGQSGMAQSVSGIWIFFGVMAVWLVVQASYPWWLARRHGKSYELRWFNRWYIYLLLIVIFGAVYDLALDRRDVLFGYATYRVPSFLEHGAHS